MRPNEQDHIAYFSRYINLVKEDNILDALENNRKEFLDFIKQLPAEKAEHRYADGKWTIKQVINHIIDTERIFSYRALCFARGEQQTLPSYEEDLYAAKANLSNTDLNLLAHEFDLVRQATILLFKQFSEKELLAKGTTPAGVSNVLSLGYVLAGHPVHHMGVIKERYLK